MRIYFAFAIYYVFLSIIIKITKMVEKIAKTWISGQRSATLIIEKTLAEEYGLTEPAHVVLERRPEGILIRKLKL
jgi:hypothetical protein